MHKPDYCLFAFVIAVFCANVFAKSWKPMIPDIKQEKMLLSKGKLDHLVPVTGFKPHREKFIVEYSMRGSFKDSKLWLLNKNGDKYIISLWIENDYGQLYSRKIPAYKKKEVSEKMASLLYVIWVNALYDVRYPKVDFMGADGTCHYFSAFLKGYGSMDGFAWSPMNEEILPHQMAKAGSSVIAFIDGEINEEQLTDVLSSIKKKIFGYLSDQAVIIQRDSERDKQSDSQPKSTVSDKSDESTPSQNEQK